MNSIPQAPDRRLRAIAIVSLSLLTVMIVTSFVLFYQNQDLRNRQPVVKVFGFYEICEALAPAGGGIDIHVDRREKPLAVTVNVASDAEFERLERLVPSMATTAASIEVRHGDRSFRYLPPAMP